jgi:predicted enzyme related to lactoylglutathione lyase
MLNADKPERAIKFYEKVFGWEITKWEGPFEYWNVKTGKDDEPGIDGGLVKRMKPGDRVENVIDVASVDEYIKKVEKNNGTMISPKTPIIGVGYLAWFKDTEGNVFGIMETDETAK